MVRQGTACTVVIPAHDEEVALPRLLRPLLEDAHPGEFRVLVVCNGCTDGTAEVAATFAGVEVLSIPTASKYAAIEEGGAATDAFPIVFVDADVALDTAGLRALVATLRDDDGILATAPRRRLERAGVSMPAKWYYDVWERLPQVRTGLFGRGVIALSEPGWTRVSALPRYTSDDAAFSDAFRPEERTITLGAESRVWPARTWTSLLKRRIRAVGGMRELRAAGRSPASSATHPRDLAAIVVREPRMLLRMPVFLLMTVAARSAERRVRRTGRSGWLRDETSRVA
ncbi:glycosyltransferase [Agromyces sp. NPDC057679]|uniref:glycosyltransferase n=1 Tax=Agromyces sp. NPDC057679 TaxID=3346207 RepID=UPI00367256AE